MDATLLYIARAALVLTLLYLPFALLMRHNAHLRTARMVLLSIIVLSFVLPAVDVHGLAPTYPQPSPTWDGGNLLAVLYHETDLSASSLVGEGRVGTLMGFLYLFVLLSVLTLRGMQVLMLRRRIRQGCLWVEQRDEYTIYCHAQELEPFSWFSHVVISQRDYEDNGVLILCHEAAHVRLGHSYDLMLLMVCQALLWFNPVVWLMPRTMRRVHECEADRCVLLSGADRHQYQMLLIKKAVACDWPAFANSLKSNNLKQRFTMMTQKSHNLATIARLAALVPAVLLSLSLFATPVEQHDDDPDSVFYVIEKLPEFPGGEQKLNEFIADNIKFPDVARQAGVKGCVVIGFIVEADGSLTDVNVVRTVGSGEAADALNREAIRVVKSMPRWTPGKMHDQPVRVKLNLPFLFK